MRRASVGGVLGAHNLLGATALGRWLQRTSLGRCVKGFGVLRRCATPWGNFSRVDTLSARWPPWSLEEIPRWECR